MATPPCHEQRAGRQRSSSQDLLFWTLGLLAFPGFDFPLTLMLSGPNCGWLDVTCEAAGLPGEELVISRCDSAFSLSAGHSKDLQGSVNTRWSLECPAVILNALLTPGGMWEELTAWAALSWAPRGPLCREQVPPHPEVGVGLFTSKGRCW